MIIRHYVKIMRLDHFAMLSNVKEEHVAMDMSATKVAIVSRLHVQHVGKYRKHLIYARSKFYMSLSMF